MSYESNKGKVLEFFDNYIMKYIITDLEVLESISPDNSGTGGCTIPQAISTFSALDLIGYLIHSQEIKTVGMSFSDLLNNEIYFPEFKEFTSHAEFLSSFRDDIRSIMVHRFSLAKFDITKDETGHLFIDVNGHQTFNTSYFTILTINAIKKIYSHIKNDTFNINGDSKENTIEKIKIRIEKLRNFEGNGFVPSNNLPKPTTTPQTTRPLG